MKMIVLIGVAASVMLLSGCFAPTSSANVMPPRLAARAEAIPFRASPVQFVQDAQTAENIDALKHATIYLYMVGKDHQAVLERLAMSLPEDVRMSVASDLEQTQKKLQSASEALGRIR